MAAEVLCAHKEEIKAPDKAKCVGLRVQSRAVLPPAQGKSPASEICILWSWFFNLSTWLLKQPQISLKGSNAFVYLLRNLCLFVILLVEG